MVLCVVLAGGASLRFGGGKLSWRGFGGIPLLARVVEALEESGVCRDVLVVASPLTITDVQTILHGSYTIVEDPGWLPCSGPLRGMAAAALQAGNEPMQFAAGDMPWLKPEAVAALVDIAKRMGASAAAPMWRTGFVQTLAGFISNTWLAVEACLRRRGLARPSDVYRASGKLILVGSKLLGDGDGRTFVSVNTPEEALNPSPDPPGESLIDASSASEHHKLALKVEEEAGDPRALYHYYHEAIEYIRLGVKHFAKHAWQDYCEALKLQGYNWDVAKHLPGGLRCRGRSQARSSFQ